MSFPMISCCFHYQTPCAVHHLVTCMPLSPLVAMVWPCAFWNCNRRVISFSFLCQERKQKLGDNQSRGTVCSKVQPQGLREEVRENLRMYKPWSWQHQSRHGGFQVQTQLVWFWFLGWQFCAWLENSQFSRNRSYQHRDHSACQMTQLNKKRIFLEAGAAFLSHQFTTLLSLNYCT